jgi:hypothetical protein
VGRLVVGRSSDEILHLISEFFDKRDDVHLTMHRVTECLREENISYAITGGMAMCLHGFMRVTGDLDLLITSEALDRIHARLTDLALEPAFQGARKRLRDIATGVLIDIITTGEYPGDGKPKAVRFPDPSDSVELDGYVVISLPRLVESKIVSGTTVDYRQLQDLGDVQAISRELRVPRSFAEQLDPSVRSEFDRRWLLAQKHDPEFD